MVGEFASQKIDETIRFLEHAERKRKFTDKQNRLKEGSKRVEISGADEQELRTEETELEMLYETFAEKNKEEHLKLIKSIGESVLSVKLLEMYSEAFPSSRRDILQEQIATLTQQFNQLND